MFYFITCFLLATSVSFAKSQIQFSNEVAVSAVRELTLADLVTVENVGKDDLRLLDSVSVAKKTVWTAAEISEVLKENRQFGRFKILLPQKMTIQFESQLSRKHLERRIANEIKAVEGKAQVEVRLHSLPKISGEIVFIDWSYVKRGSFLLPLSLQNDPNPTLISAQSRVLKQLPVAQRQISPQFRVQKEDIKIDWVDVTFSKENELLPEEIIGQNLNRGVSFGQPILPSYVKREPIVKKGQLMRAQVGGNDFEISVNVIAEEAGFVGDTILVRPTDTQKKLSAVIEDREKVRIQ